MPYYNNYQNPWVNGYGQTTTVVPTVYNNAATPINWNQPQPMPRPVQQAEPVQPINNAITFTFVNGADEAMKYPCPPNGETVNLMDSQSMVIYAKHWDSMTNQQVIEVYDMVKREPAVPESQNGIGMSKEDLDKYVSSKVEAEVKRLLGN